LDHRLVPYVHVVVALVGQVVIFVGSSFYLREGAAINPVLLDAPVIATLADPTIVNMEFICSVIALPLLFDLLLDIATYFWALFKGRTAAAAAAAASDRLNEDDTASLNSQMTRPMLPLLEVRQPLPTPCPLPRHPHGSVTPSFPPCLPFILSPAFSRWLWSG
jgi:hypothetical protein